MKKEDPQISVAQVPTNISCGLDLRTLPFSHKFFLVFAELKEVQIRCGSSFFSRSLQTVVIYFTLHDFLWVLFLQKSSSLQC